SDLDVFAACGLFGEAQRLFDSTRDKVEGGSTFHDQRLTFVVRQNEGWRMVRRIVAPPALPRAVWPRAAHRPEHVASQDESAEVVHCPVSEYIVHITCGSSF